MTYPFSVSTEITESEVTTNSRNYCLIFTRRILSSGRLHQKILKVSPLTISVRLDDVLVQVEVILVPRSLS